MEDLTLFLSIPVSNDFEKNFLRYKALCDAPDNVSWTPTENLHITVVYIGVVPEVVIPKLSHVLRSALLEHAPFTITCSKVSQSPNQSVSNMLWAYFEQNTAFDDLVQVAVRTLLSVGIQPKDTFKLQSNKYIPHVTVARGEGCPCVSQKCAHGNAVLAQSAIVVNEIQLLASVTEHSVRKYICLETFPFGNNT